MSQTYQPLAHPKIDWPNYVRTSILGLGVSRCGNHWRVVDITLPDRPVVVDKECHDCKRSAKRAAEALARVLGYVRPETAAAA